MKSNTLQVQWVVLSHLIPCWLLTMNCIMKKANSLDLCTNGFDKDDYFKNLVALEECSRMVITWMTEFGWRDKLTSLIKILWEVLFPSITLLLACHQAIRHPQKYQRTVMPTQSGIYVWKSCRPVINYLRERQLNSKSKRKNGGQS